MNRLIALLFTVLFGVLGVSHAQEDVHLVNPSFEGDPRQGTIQFGYFYTPLPNGWSDCGRFIFPEETPPDIHPNNYWKNTTPASEGNTYLGMVVRSNETWESATQRLTGLLRKDVCYDLTVDLSRSNNYWSRAGRKDTTLQNYKTPAVLRIWGGTGICNKEQLLVESDPVSNESWEEYSFTVQPKTNFRYLTIEAFYKTPILEPYMGHILVDNFSTFKAYPCGEEPPILASVTPPTKEKTKPTKQKTKPPHKAIKKPPVKKDPEVVAEQKVVPSTASPQKKIMTELDREKIVTGQTIKIKNLYFAADSTEIGYDSFEVLDEIYGFLQNNQDIKVEIGGHTNIKPPHEYCDSLSTLRAKAVASYLTRKGIRPNRLEFKGYGKRDPVIRSKSNFASRKNQRVEIKILSIG